MGSLRETIILSFATVFLLIGIHQSMQYGTVTEGISNSYWLFMLSVSLLIFLKLGRTKKASDPVLGKKEKKPVQKTGKR